MTKFFGVILDTSLNRWHWHFRSSISEVGVFGRELPVTYPTFEVSPVWRRNPNWTQLEGHCRWIASNNGLMTPFYRYGVLYIFLHWIDLFYFDKRVWIVWTIFTIKTFIGLSVTLRLYELVSLTLSSRGLGELRSHNSLLKHRMALDNEIEHVYK